MLIRANSHIEGARLASGVKVGPLFARLRPGTVLEQGSFVGNFVEVKNAVLWRWAPPPKGRAPPDLSGGCHHRRRGANIGAGTITCNPL